MSSPSRQRGFLRFLLSWATVVIALVAWLLFAPVPIQPMGWNAGHNKGYTDPHAANTKLAGLQTLPLGKGQEGPEHIIARGDHLFTALANGDVVRIAIDGGQSERLINTGGRPLGLDLSADGRTLFIADAYKGLLSFDLNGGQRAFRLLANDVDHPVVDDPIRYADAVALDGLGVIWLTDASRRFGAAEVGSTFEASVLDIFEHSCTGRLIAHDPRTVRTRVVLEGLCFPNGLLFSRDGKHLFLAETGTYRVLKVDLARLSVLRTEGGAAAVPTVRHALAQGAAKVLIDNLPGFPDNLTRGADGRIWVGLTKPRSPILDYAADKPWVRSALLRLPRQWWPVPKPYGHVIAFDEQGRILDDLQDPQGTVPETTSATEAKGRLFIQSLHADVIGSMPYTGPVTAP